MQSVNESKCFQVPACTETVPTPVNKTGLWRFFTPVRQEKISPCQALCPLENAVPHWMDRVKNGCWEEAWQIMRRYNPFPAITGYTCYQFCREKCNRGFFDEAVAIGEVEKEIGLWRLRNFSLESPVADNYHFRKDATLKDKKVAIVGSGPAGLSCAYYLNMWGAAVTVLEKLPVCGGLLATGIPRYRLPRNVLAQELEILQAQGILFKAGVEVGKDVSLEDLGHNYDAVLLATGAQQGSSLNVRGEDLDGVTGALDFLRDMHLNHRSGVKGQVVVVGGGNAALDAASVARRHGAEQVILLYRRSREEMPAHPAEIKAAEEAGVKFVFQTVIEGIIGRGKVERVHTRQVAPSRRGEALSILPGTDVYLECNLLVVAAGQRSTLAQLAPALAGPPGGEKRDNSSGEIPEIIFQEKKPIAAAGDAFTGPASVARAIFGGRKAALALAGALCGLQKAKGLPAIALPLNRRVDAVNYSALNPSLYSKHGRFSSSREEAGRCFNCGICTRCGVCWIFCPDLAVESHSGNFEFLLDYCKGCGICVAECPTGVLQMEEVGSSGA